MRPQGALRRIEVTDLGDNRIAVAVAGQTETVEFHPRIDREQLENLRWYIEDFEDSPFGGARERAQTIAGAMQDIGIDLLKEIAGTRCAQEAFKGAQASQIKLELILRSARDEFLALPWELAQVDRAQGFLAEQGLAIVREHLAATAVAARTRPPGPLRLLLMIARPQQLSVPPIATIAEPLLRIAGGEHSPLEVDVLRPPTAARLRQQLAQRDYDFVHFDGHGVFPSIADLRGDESAQGHLIFESDEGFPDAVSAAELVAALPQRVPIFILNACQSGRESLEQPMSSVAAQLLLAGSPAVLAMAHVVRADTVYRFMQPFYNALVGDANLAQAVAQARQALLRENERAGRPQDWFVPVLFLNGPSQFAEPSSFVPSTRRSDLALNELSRLLGRGDEVIAAERACQRSPCVLLTGAMGTGKSEFCRSFAAWYKQTGGTGRVIALDMVDCGSIDDALEKTSEVIGGRLHGKAVKHRSDQERLVAQDGVMLIWDRAETLAAAEDTIGPLQQFTEALREIGGTLLMTTAGIVPKDMPWPRIALSDLNNSEGSRRLSQGLPHDTMERLLSAPSALRRVIMATEHNAQALDMVVAAAAVAPVETAVEELQWGVGAGGLFSDPRIDAAYSQLSAQARRVLPVLGLFGARVQPGALAIFTHGGLKDDVFARLYGAPVDEEEWRRLLLEASALGLAENMYEGHIFALSPLVRRRLRQALNEWHANNPDCMEQLTGGFIQWCVGLAVSWSADEHNARIVIVEEYSFSRALLASIARKRFSEAATLLQCLSMAWDRTGASFVRWSIAEDLEWLTGAEFPANATELEFWAQLRSIRADAAVDKGDLRLITELDLETLERLEGRQERPLQRYAAVSLQRLVRAYAHSGGSDAARSYLDRLEPLAVSLGDAALIKYCTDTRNALKRAGEAHVEANDIDNLGDALTPQAAMAQERAGVAARARKDYASAHAYFTKAFRWWKQLGLEGNAMNTRGLVADALVGMGQVREALPIYEQQVRYYERTGQWGRAANGALMIGQTYEQLGELEQARRWCDSAAPVMERLGMQMELAHVKHELSIIALSSPTPDFQEAATHLREAIAAYEKLGSPYHQASSLMILAQVQRALGENIEALATLRLSVQVCPSFGVDEMDANRRELLAAFEAGAAK